MVKDTSYSMRLSLAMPIVSAPFYRSAKEIIHYSRRDPNFLVTRHSNLFAAMPRSAVNIYKFFKSLPFPLWPLFFVLLPFFFCSVLDARGTEEVKPPSFTILYTGNTLEEIKPCGCSQEADLGGLPRRGSAIKSVREREKNVLVLDAGDSLKGTNAQGRLKADFIARAMSLIKYDAALPGEKDFKYGAAFFATPGFNGWLASNLNYPGTSFLKIIVKEFPTGDRVGIIGLIDPNLFPNASHIGISIESPKEFLKEHLHSLLLENKVTIPILLFHGPDAQAREIFEEFQQIRIIVAGHIEDTGKETPQDPILTGVRGIFFADNRGRNMGEITVSEGGVQALRHCWVALDGSIADDPTMASPLAEYKQSTKKLFLEKSEKEKKAKENSPYTSAESCLPCHEEIVLHWRKTRHASALETLESEGQSFDPECVGCHVAGYGSGGYVNREITPTLGGVQCESCHGPGKQHIAETSKAYGKANEEACRRCHTGYKDPRFTFKEYWEKIRHVGG
jgi:hypothetical protein